MDLDKRYQNLDAHHTCTNCSAEVTPSKHCGHPMHLEDLESGREWVCWMGASCGHKAYEACCDSPSLPVFEIVNP